MDYQPWYECEVRRADKAEDALAAAIARIAELEAQLAGAVFVVVNGTEFRFRAGEWRPAPGESDLETWLLMDNQGVQDARRRE